MNSRLILDKYLDRFHHAVTYFFKTRTKISAHHSCGRPFIKEKEVYPTRLFAIRSGSASIHRMDLEGRRLSPHNNIR